MSQVQTIAVFLLSIVAAGCAALFWIVILLNGMSHGTSGDFPLAGLNQVKWAAVVLGSLSAFAAFMHRFNLTDSKPIIGYIQMRLLEITSVIGLTAAVSILMLYLGG